ncbi:iron ABC transporter permease [Jeotgalibacillus sp. S-D1]|nr:iron ABC transporter permease [Jeotgalibacillus sp. S-D1]
MRVCTVGKVFQKIRSKLNIWAILSIIFIAIIIIPNLLIALNLFTESNENWQHIKEYLLKDYITNTVILISFTALITTVIGVSLAWFVTMFEFPFRRFFKWGLILPLAIPPYIGAYAYHGLLNYTGVIQSILRNNFELEVNQEYFSIMNNQGAIFIFSIFLFPYVYTITKTFLQNQSSSLIENTRLLGSNSFETFFRVILPISRAAIFGSVTLVVLEVLNDYGVVNYFGIQTFSTAIFRTWYGMKDLDSALKLAGALMFLVIFILILEKVSRGRKRFSSSTTKIRPIQPKKVKGVKAWLIFGFCFSVFSIAFLIPFIQLLYWAFLTFESVFTAEFIQLIYQSVLIAAITSFIIVVIALIIGNYSRLHKGFLTTMIARVTTLGYSIPGAAIAISIITIFVALDGYLSDLYNSLQMDPVIILRTSLVMLVSAYIIRFLAIGYNAIDAGYEKMGNTFTEASRTLGFSTITTFFKVDLPMMRTAMFGGFILVFIDVLKELPLTLFLQPFNFATLATQAYKYANDERVHEAALASILIILVSGIFIFASQKLLEKEPK